MSSTQRLDKFIANATDFSRSQIKRAIGKGMVTVNGEIIRSPAHHIHASDEVVVEGRRVREHQPRYIMMNKPSGYICATEGDIHPCVLELLDIENRAALHTAGRLDVDTTGLVLITDDGQWSHQITSPKRACNKVYQATLAEPVEESAIALFAEGVQLKSEDRPTLPAKLVIKTPQSVELTLQEGRYHQVKRMFASLGNKVETLHRVQIGQIRLDPELVPGQWRYLTEKEIQLDKTDEKVL